MYGLLKAKNESMAHEVLDLAGELIRTPSPSFAEGDVAAVIEKQMRATGYDEVVRDECGNVLGILHGRQAGPVLLLNGHMDTAPAGDEAAWSDPVHSGRSDRGTLHGLGASDCKGGLAAQLYAGALLKRCLLPLRGTLVVAATVAEETGTSSGVRGLVQKTLADLDLKPNYCVLCDPTDLGLYYGHDGWMEMDIRVQGGNPFHVRDAAQAIRQGFDGGRRLSGGDGPCEFQSVRADQDEGDENGTTLRLVRRLLPSESENDVLSDVSQSVATLARSAGSVAAQVAVRSENQRLYTGQTTVVRYVANAWATDPFHPLMERSRQALTAAGCEVRPGRWVLGRLGMGTAGGALSREFNIPTIGYGPGDETKCHTPNESVAHERIVEATYGTAAIAHALVGVPVCGWTSDEI